MNTPSDSFEGFHRAEYESLRAEVAMLVSQTNNLVYLCVSAASITGAWTTIHSTTVPAYFFAGPLLIFLIAYLLREGKDAHVAFLAAYISDIENRYADPQLRGWGHRLAELRPNRRAAKADRILWTSLFGASALFLVQRFIPA